MRTLSEKQGIYFFKYGVVAYLVTLLILSTLLLSSAHPLEYIVKSFFKFLGVSIVPFFILMEFNYRLFEKFIFNSASKCKAVCWTLLAATLIAFFTPAFATVASYGYSYLQSGRTVDLAEASMMFLFCGAVGLIYAIPAIVVFGSLLALRSSVIEIS